MSTSQYDFLRQALLNRTPCSAVYDNLPRFICPHVIGSKKGEEQVLVWQYAGETSDGPITEPLWKCLKIAKLSQLAIAPGEWRAGVRGPTGVPTTCVGEVDEIIEL